MHVLAYCPLMKVYDTLYDIDLSGDGQVVYVGESLKPFRLKSVPGCRVSFVYVGDTFEHREVAVSGDSLAIYPPPVPQRPTDVKLIAYTEDTTLTLRARVLREGYWFLKLLEILGGFVLFMFGLNRGSTGIMRAVGGWTRDLLTRLSKNPLMAAIGGLIAALGFQSSTAVTVMVVSFADLGFLTPASAMAMNAGAGIGTTLTVGILSLGLTYVSILVMAVGYYLENFTTLYTHYGRALFGYGLAFFGIWQMGNSFSDMANLPYVVDVLQGASGNLPLTAAGAALFAALVHSSALTIGIALSMAFAGMINFETALAVVLGANVGTAFTAVLASTRLSSTARKVALINLVGRMLLATALLPTIPLAKSLPLWVEDISKNIALSHIYYNLIFASIMVSLAYVKPLWKTPVSAKEGIKVPVIYSDPEILLVYMEKVVMDALNTSIKMFREVYDAIRTRSPAIYEEVAKMDDEIDRAEETVNAYVSKVFTHDTSKDISRRVVALAQIMEEIENIGDIISKSVMRSVEKMYKEGIALSEGELSGIRRMHDEVMKTLATAMLALSTWDREKAEELVMRGQEAKSLLVELRKEFYRGVAFSNVQSGEIYLDILSDMERVNQNAASIGEAILESLQESEG